MHDIEKYPWGFQFTLGSLIDRINNNGTARWAAVALGAAVLPFILHAQPSGHYVPGTEGLEGPRSRLRESICAITRSQYRRPHQQPLGARD